MRIKPDRSRSIPQFFRSLRMGATGEWIRTFADVFGDEPSEEQVRQLRWMAESAGALTAPQRYRRILAAFDQQVLETPFSVRWAAEDAQLHKVNGFSMYLDAADISVSQVIAGGSYEPHLVDFFERFLAPGMHVIDVGANIGFYSLLSAKLVGEAGRVWSFEPNSENARLLLASSAENGFAHVELHPVALGNSRGYVEFVSALGSNGGLADEYHRGIMRASCRIVPIARLDDFGIARAELMKMDIEGAEALLVEGATETIRRCRPVIVSEFSFEMLHRVSRRHGGQFIQSVQELGYATFVSDRESHALTRVEDPFGFAEPFAGTGRIEDIVFCPLERIESLPLVA